MVTAKTCHGCDGFDDASRRRRERAGQAALLVAAFHWIVLAPGAAAAGTPVSGPVSGVWGMAGSPYWVESDLEVAGGNTLLIEPGVAVRFRGPYRFLVHGTLQAAGTVTDSIFFTWDEPLSAMEWRGLRLVGADPATQLEFCTIEHVRSATAFPEVRGGAIYCESCSPGIRHCLLQQNVSHNANANGMGGGVACVFASPTIEHCVVRDNQADSGGGIATLEEGSAIIRNNLITGNTAPNSGGGIYAGVRSSPVIENNVISQNSASGWGGGGITLWNWYALFPYSKTVRNNIVADNSTTAVGGGFYIRYDFSVLDNNTVTGNHASQRGGGVYVLNAGPGDFPPHLRNAIIWGNTAGIAAPSIHPDPSTGSVVTVSFSDVAGGWPGTGNIDSDPLFADPEHHLTAASPCVDAGNPAATYDDVCFPPSLGTLRDDQGAYGGPLGCEWASATTSIGSGGAPARGRAPAIGAVLRGGVPNPFAAATEVRYELLVAGRVELGVYDVGGHLIRRLVAGRDQPAGRHRITWDGKDTSGRKVASGVYVLRLALAGRSTSRHVIVLQ